MVALNFDANLYEPNQTFSPLPAGEYKVCVTGTKMDTKGTGISIGFDVIDGEHQGRKVWQWLGFMHPNPNLVDMAQKNLSSICRAVNKMLVVDSDDLVGSSLMVSVKIQPKDPSRNDVVGHAPLPGFDQPMAAPQWHLSSHQQRWSRSSHPQRRRGDDLPQSRKDIAKKHVKVS